MVGDAIISHNAEYTKFIRQIVPAPTLKMVALQLRVLSGGLTSLEHLPAVSLMNDYDIASPEHLNGLGYMLLFADRADDAITVFKTNTRLFPDEPNCYDSLGEALEYNNQKDLALANYDKACQKAREKNDTRLETYEKNYDRLKGAGKEQRHGDGAAAMARYEWQAHRLVRR
ncbi:MAG: hypothetical protein FJ276_13735 [Planctomycetes bacterium]|nr:hypothetical protein [Planctomycetota bacterium]